MTKPELTIGEILSKTILFLTERQIPNPRLEADLMLAKVLDQSRVKLYAQWDRVLNGVEVQNYRELILKRVQGWPLAYLTGKRSFLSWDFIVSPAVLIPRPETELLIEVVRGNIQEHFKNKPQIIGIDVGTGSGVIAIALAKFFPQSTWYGSDISEESLQIANANAINLGVAPQLHFITGDLLEPLKTGPERYDIIISNPPYIPSSQIATLQKEVRQEPIQALDGGDDGLAIYRRLIPEAWELLADNGIIALEHGFDQRESLEKILIEQGFTSVTSFQDLAGLNRVLIARRENRLQ